MVVNEIHGNVLMRMLSVTYNTHTSRIIIIIFGGGGKLGQFGGGVELLGGKLPLRPPP